MATAADGTPAPTCEYFALCTNDADGIIDAGPIGQVPTCQRCADKVARMGGGPLLQVASWTPVFA